LTKRRITTYTEQLGTVTFYERECDTCHKTSNEDYPPGWIIDQPVPRDAYLLRPSSDPLDFCSPECKANFVPIE
jgi:hypothetical protein